MKTASGDDFLIVRLAAQQEARHQPENADIGAAESSKSRHSSRPPCFSSRL